MTHLSSLGVKKCCFSGTGKRSQMFTSKTDRLDILRDSGNLQPMAAITFYFDLASPYAYLAATRIDKLFKHPVQWQPILLGALFKRFHIISWEATPERAANIQEIERRAKQYGLPPV